MRIAYSPPPCHPRHRPRRPAHQAYRNSARARPRRAAGPVRGGGAGGARKAAGQHHPRAAIAAHRRQAHRRARLALVPPPPGCRSMPRRRACSTRSPASARPRHPRDRATRGGRRRRRPARALPPAGRGGRRVPAVRDHQAAADVGGIFRNAAAFGIAAILLDPDCCDPLYRKAIRVSVGAALTLPFARLARGEDALALLARHAIAPVALDPSGEEALPDWTPAPRNAVLLGAEGPGLDPALIAHVPARCGSRWRTGSIRSNVATTSGIVVIIIWPIGRLS
ncbi:TrmH family RNA methyltransferase [Sphingomonas sp. MMS24-JH45]